uniref:CUE domain-containing protein n=1 Tax=Panagrolaimus sp. JU765 TaxID=591449 RepID=A0AC34R0F0_9BILA
MAWYQVVFRHLANLPAMINWNPPVNQVVPPVNMPLPNAQNNFDPETIGTLEEMFPQIDIRKVLQIYHGQFYLERVSEFIINNEQTMPKKAESLKRKADTTLEATMNSISEDDPEEGTKVLDIVLKKLAAHFD